MSGTPFQTFIDLVALDQKIVALEKEREKDAQNLQDVKQKKHALYEKLEQLKQVIHEARKRVDMTELEMQELDEKETRQKALLDTSTKLKEYNAVKSELDTTHEAQQEKEQEVLEAWNKLELAENACKAYQKDLDKHVAACDVDIASYQKYAKKLEETVKDYVLQRPEKEKAVPEEWVEKYTMMRARVSDPVVPVVDGACFACFNELTNQIMLRVSRGALMQCKGCFRLLYDPTLQKSG